MGLPRKLKNINAYVDGGNYLGRIAEFEEPTLALQLEEYRGGGMLGGVQIDMGLQAMESMLKMGGHEASLIRKFGTPDIEGTRLRLVGAFVRDDTGQHQTVECFMGGRFSEIGFGTAKAGDDTEHEYKFPLNYYRRVVDNIPRVVIDMLAGRFIVDGVDRYGEIMDRLNS